MTCRHNLVGFAGGKDRDAVGALYPFQGPRDRVFQAHARTVGLFDKMGQDLGVGLRAEFMAALDERFAQRRPVFDDAIVNQRYGATAVGVRVRVDFVGHAVRGPAGVRKGNGSLGETSGSWSWERST